MTPTITLTPTPTPLPVEFWFDPPMDFEDVKVNSFRAVINYIKKREKGEMTVYGFRGPDKIELDAPELPVVLSSRYYIRLALVWRPTEVGELDDIIYLLGQDDEILGEMAIVGVCIPRD